jgi:glyoxylase-like metal-dependent hydrolase (beta-lactamase superfamily II)
MDAPYFIKSFVDTGLGNSAYLIGSHDTKKGILIDPLRDVDRYLHAASELGLTLTHILDTHLHADFVSGNREIAHQTGAVIGASAEAKVGFEHNPLTTDSVIDLGAFQVRVMATPGHTPEHISFLVVEPDNETPSALFSGGALIVGGAARTDLLTPERWRVTCITPSTISCLSFPMNSKYSPRMAQVHFVWLRHHPIVQQPSGARETPMPLHSLKARRNS